MFTCYLDETEAHDAAEPITGVAGFLYRDCVLGALEAEWSARTAHLGGPFHARKHSRNNRIMADLARIIAKYRQIGFVCTVSNSGFAEWAQNASSSRDWFGNPYSLALSYVLGMVRIHLKQDGLDGDVTYVIEDGAAGKVAGEAFLERVRTKRREPFRLGGFEFVRKDDPQAVLLGTADHLAWVWQKNYREVECEEAQQEEARRRGEPEKGESGWTEAFRAYYTPNAPPIWNRHIDREGIPLLALQFALEGLHRD